MPEFLEGSARAKWLEVAPKLVELGLLTELDLDMLAVYCETWSDWRATRATVNSAPVGADPVPLRRREKELRTALRQLAAEFGFSPATRSRVTLPAGRPDPDRDPMEALLDGGL